MKNKSEDKASWGRRRKRSRSSLFAIGEPMIWLTGGALVMCVLMVSGLLLLVLAQGLMTFWPQPIRAVETHRGVYMGEVTRVDRYQPEVTVLDALPESVRATADQQLAKSDGWADRRLVRTGNYRLTQTHFQWVSDYEVLSESLPEWAVVMERLEWGRFYGFPKTFIELDENGNERRREEGPEATWAAFQEVHDEVRARWRTRRSLEKHDTGKVNRAEEKARLALRSAELELDAAKERGSGIEAAQTAVADAEKAYEETRLWAEKEFDRIRAEINAINDENGRYKLVMRVPGEGAIEPSETTLRLDDIVRAYPANKVSFIGKLGLYFDRWGEFLVDEPREANSEGGVFPAIFGTVAMTFIMSIAVVPFGVMAALYLREYAKAGAMVTSVRIAVNNLAGVPSIVFGVFGLGFFCYVMGAGIDQLFFAESLPNPTYGTGGLLWASFTLALLTLPVVIVATEEAISAVPNSMREGSYACGASKWQTIRKIVLPRAMPGIITGMILAIARGAGEVAPLMLVGAVKLAPELPIDGVFPFLHPERSFMHLGFHIYDVGFQSQNSEAAKPMVFTTTLILILIVAVLNFAAIYLRGRLRKRFSVGQF